MDTRPGKRPRFPKPATGPCWICGRPTWWNRKSATWQGKDYCWLHHPRTRHRYASQPNARRSLVFLRAEDDLKHPGAHRHWGVYSNAQAITKAKEDKLQREIDAKLGRRKRKAAKPRKRPRDRRYVR